MTDLAEVREFAVKAHGSQTRKDGKTPYWTHLDGVVEILQEAGVTDDVTLSAAYLHDVLEDTKVTLTELAEKFGIEISSVVLECTRQPGVHRDVYSNHFKTASHNACIIKLADRLYNLEDWSGMEAGYRPKYSAEGMEIVTRILRNDKTKRWSSAERDGAKRLMERLTFIFLTENRFGVKQHGEHIIQ